MATYSGFYLKDFTPPLSWYFTPPAEPLTWETPFSPEGYVSVYQYIYVGFFYTHDNNQVDGIVTPMPAWWVDEHPASFSWPGLGTPGAPPGYYQVQYWPLGHTGYKPCYDLIACCGAANDPAFPSAVPFGNKIDYGWLAYQKPGTLNYYYIFWPRALGERSKTQGYASILPTLCASALLLLPAVLGTNLGAAMSAARRRYRNS